MHDAGGRELAVLEVLQSAICVYKGVDPDLGLNRDFGSESQEVADVFARAVRYAAHDALVVKQIVVERWYLGHGDAREGEGSRFAQMFEG